MSTQLILETSTPTKNPERKITNTNTNMNQVLKQSLLYLNQLM
ncbi:hypothetical protein [Dulcicalothrix desertica]|nr:hypothetical protein [Dulcicalothrix desertica]